MDAWKAPDTEQKAMRTNSENTSEAAMLGSFMQALNASITKTTRLCSLFEKRLTEEVHDEVLPKLLVLMKEVECMYVYNVTWSGKFGCDLSTPGRARIGLRSAKLSQRSEF